MQARPSLKTNKKILVPSKHLFTSHEQRITAASPFGETEMMFNVWNSSLPLNLMKDPEDDMVGNLEPSTRIPSSQPVEQTMTHMIQSADSPLIQALAYNVLQLKNDKCNTGMDGADPMESDKVMDVLSPTQQPEYLPVPKHPPQRTVVPIVKPTDSPLMPVVIYNSQRLDGNRSDNGIAEADSMDWYAWYLKAQKQPLVNTLRTSGKVLTTHEWNVAQWELEAIKTMERIEKLKSTHLWSFKQLRRHTSVPRTETHWDCLLNEMKWMRTDFKEERKWKIATAYMISRAVMEWHESSDKTSVCVAKQRQQQQPPASTSTCLSSFPADATTLMDTPTANSEDIVGQHSVISTKSYIVDMDMNYGSATGLEFATTSNMNKKKASEFLQHILEYDETRTIATLPSDKDEQLDMLNLSLPSTLLYAPPDPNANDPYLNESEYGRIVPVTKVPSFIKRDASKRTHADQPALLQQSMANETAPSNTGPSDSTFLFDLKKTIEPLSQSPPSAPSSPPPTSPTPTPASGSCLSDEWTKDDDLCLASLNIQVSFNWDLICDTFNSIRRPFSIDNRTPWELHQRWRQNNLTTLSGEVNQDTTKLQNDQARQSSSMVALDTPRKKQHQYNMFQAIMESNHRKNEAHRSTYDPPLPPKTIQSHGKDSYGNQLPTAMELSLYKEERDRQQ